MRIVGSTFPTNTLLQYGFDLEFKPGKGPLFSEPEACSYFEPTWSEACVTWPKLHPGHVPEYRSIIITRSLALDPKSMKPEGAVSILPPGEDLLDIALFTRPGTSSTKWCVYLRVSYGKKGVRAAEDIFELGALMPAAVVLH